MDSWTHAATLALALHACGGQAVIDGTDGSGGAGEPDCDQLERDYAEQLKLARGCYLAVSMWQCSLRVDDELRCACPTYVNPANEEAVAKLAELQASWSKKDCGWCTNASCVATESGFCEPAPQGSAVEALCEDQH